MASLTISAVHEVHHTPARVWAFLERLDNHRHLNSRALRVSLIDEDGHGGRIVVATPLGLRRAARTAVTSAHEPNRLAGVVHVGRKTRAHVEWRIESTERGTRVALESMIYSTGVLDRTLLRVGGRWWLRRVFHRTLELLASALDSAYEPGAPARTLAA
jgi:Polyketide cyclase / dehydrase and lipid transport